jgi:hypothetical protein
MSSNNLKNIFKNNTSHITAPTNKRAGYLGEDDEYSLIPKFILDEVLKHLEEFDYLLGCYFLGKKIDDPEIYDGFIAFVKSSNEEFKNYEFLKSIEDSVNTTQKSGIIDFLHSMSKNSDWSNAVIHSLTIHLDVLGAPPFGMKYVHNLQIQSSDIEDINEAEILKNAKWIPQEINLLTLDFPNLKSAKRIHKIFENVFKMVVYTKADVLKNVLGFCLIKKLSSVTIIAPKGFKNSAYIYDTMKIVNKYCGTNMEKVIDCQNELIEANLEEAAGL